MCKDLKFARARVPGQPGLQKKGGGLLESDFFEILSALFTSLINGVQSMLPAAMWTGQQHNPHLGNKKANRTQEVNCPKPQSQG